MTVKRQNNNKIFTAIRKKMNLIQNDRLNLQKIHQIARLVPMID